MEFSDGDSDLENLPGAGGAPDRDKALYHILAEAGNTAAAEKLVEEYREKVTEWAKE
jgi:hypothetical protein